MNRAVARNQMVAVGLKSWADFSAAAVAGILRYGRENRGFEFRDVDVRDYEEFLASMARLKPQAAILTINAADYLKVADRLPPGLPTVTIGADHVNDNWGAVCSDDRAMVEMSLAHLRQCGYEQFGWVGWKASTGSARREALCRQLVPALQSFNQDWENWTDPPDPAADLALDRWLRGLRRPVGLITWSARIAIRVCLACERHSILVPRDVGLLSLADEQICLMSDPPLSAVDVDGDAIGYQAMSLLAALVEGKRPPPAPVMIKPLRIKARGSTGAGPPTDDEIAAAVKYIDENACAGITVENVVAQITGMGRTSFYAAFTDQVGHSPADHIRLAKMARAKELLSKSRLSITRIASLCGFNSSSYFSVTFSREFQMTPLAFRRGGKK